MITPFLQKNKVVLVGKLRGRIRQRQVIKGKVWRNNKGDVIGAIVDKSDPTLFPSKLGIPEWTAHTLKYLHENASDSVSKTLPVDFLNAIYVDTDFQEIEDALTRKLLDYIYSRQTLPDQLKEVIDGLGVDPKEHWKCTQVQAKVHALLNDLPVSQLPYLRAIHALCLPVEPRRFRTAMLQLTYNLDNPVLEIDKLCTIFLESMGHSTQN